MGHAHRARLFLSDLRHPAVSPVPNELADGAAPFDGWAINVRCLEGVDLDSIAIRRVYGSRIGESR